MKGFSGTKFATLCGQIKLVKCQLRFSACVVTLQHVGHLVVVSMPSEASGATVWVVHNFIQPKYLNVANICGQAEAAICSAKGWFIHHNKGLKG